ncbi:ectin-like [Mercenaria mercenaria]|uniref:ectin-like n=1 Tax=Mercenaria mercenaria TaxID=6596 RepID=UPI00234EEEAA|nr:ectin-like [Mercenaria mercenaria]
MEFSDINKKTCDDRDTNIYENTKITSASLENAESSKSQQTEKEEGLYEPIRLGEKVNDRKSFRCEEIPTRIKYFIYIVLALFIVLYMIVIALIIFVAVPKEQAIDGEWSNWGMWTTCSDSCGGGTKSRNRSCSNPTPSTNGKQCMGNFEQIGQCNKQLCLGIDGGWSNWGDWNTCSDSCGGGIKSRNRSCSNPTPSTNGKQCMGNFEQIGQCNKQLCPGIGKYF